MPRVPQTLRLSFLLGLLVLLGGWGAGCSTNRFDEMVYVFGGYRYANPDFIGGSLSRTLLDHAGTKAICVHTAPVISAYNIVGGKVIDRGNGKYAVRLDLDRFGQNAWLQACCQLGGQRLAITTDGYYLFDMTIPHRQVSYESILIEGPWDRSQACGVVAQAQNNHQILNGETGL